MVEAARLDDGVALRALQKVARYLGIGFASLVNVLNPELIVLGGPISIAGDFLVDIINREMHGRTLCWRVQAANVVVSRFGPAATVMGGIAKVYREILANPVIQIQQSKMMSHAQNGLRA